MTDQELINAIKVINKPIQDKLEDLDLKFDNINLKISELQVQIDTLRLETKTAEKEIRRDIRRIHDGMDTLVEVLEAKDILPRAK